MKLHNLKSVSGSRKTKKIVGRGHGSGYGKTATRGTKGQLSRKSGHVRPGFEGGQTPLYRRIPKRGFKNVNRLEYNIVTLKNFANFETKVIDHSFLKKMGFVKNAQNPVKIIGKAELKKAFEVQVDRVSAGARASIEAAGGRIIE